MAQPGYGNDVFAVHAVHAHVVVVDQLVKAGADRLANLTHFRQPGQAGAKLLNRLQLCRPLGRPIPGLGVAYGMAALVSELLEHAQVVIAPVEQAVMHQHQRSDELAIRGERRDAEHHEALAPDRVELFRRAVVLAGVGHVHAAPVPFSRNVQVGVLLDRRREVARQVALSLDDEAPVGLHAQHRGVVSAKQLLGVVDQSVEDAAKVDLAVDFIADREQERGSPAVLLELGDACLALL